MSILKKYSRFFLLFLLFLVTIQVHSLVMTAKGGRWPETWPNELEPFRDRATTIEVAHGLQENIYKIPFENRDEFEAIWPVLLQLMDKSEPLRLLGGNNLKGYASGIAGETLERLEPVVYILSPAHNASAGRQDEKSLLISPNTLVHLKSPDGVLPEYVTISENQDSWIKADRDNDERRGFLFRARVGLEVVVDGEIIDLNRIPLPKNRYIIDQREWNQ